MTTKAQEQARQTAGTAADEGKHVAGVAKDEAQQLAHEATQHARGLLDEARTQMDEQSRTQKDRLAGTLQTVSNDLEQMAAQGETSGMAGDLVRQAAEKTRQLGQHLEGREPTQLLDEVRDFARRRPGTFLLGAMAAGVVAGRLTRGAKDAQSGRQQQSGSLYDDPRGTAAGDPLAGTGDPTGDPHAGTGYPTGGYPETTPSATGYPEATPPGALDQPVPGIPTQSERRGGAL